MSKGKEPKPKGASTAYLVKHVGGDALPNVDLLFAYVSLVITFAYL